MGFLAVLLLFAFGLVVAALVVGGWIVVKIVSLLISLLVGIGGEALPIAMIALGAWLVWRAVRDNRQAATRRAAQTAHRMAGAQTAGSAAGGSPPQPGQPAADARGAGRRKGRGEPTPGAAPAAYHPPAYQQAPYQPPARRELPIDVQVKAEQIQRKADLLLGYADRFPPFSQSLHIVRQTATDYLPRTIEAYLALPGTSDPVVPTTGRTALTELRAQLHLLDAKLDDITLDLQQQDLDRMSANRRFLEERFGEVRPGDEQAGGSGDADERSARPPTRREGGPNLRAVC